MGFFFQKSLSEYTSAKKSFGSLRFSVENRWETVVIWGKVKACIVLSKVRTEGFFKFFISYTVCWFNLKSSRGAGLFWSTSVKRNALIKIEKMIKTRPRESAFFFNASETKGLLQHKVVVVVVFFFVTLHGIST